ncbi:MAG: peptide deformylase, partial [Bacteroidota bacterium]
MIYPIVAYGNPILKKEAEDLAEGSDVSQLLQDMYATMDHANGVGLAAPQINQGIRLFVI